jgi:hypothetical protein
MRTVILGVFQAKAKKSMCSRDDLGGFVHRLSLGLMEDFISNSYLADPKDDVPEGSSENYSFDNDRI